jgi:hypothetical protein
VDLFAIEPFYTAALPDANASLGLLDAIGAAFQVNVPREQLAAMALQQREAIEAAVAGSEQAQALVRSLEGRHGGDIEERQNVYPSLPPGTDSAPLQESDAAAAVAEVEALFGKRDFEDDSAA